MELDKQFMKGYFLTVKGGKLGRRDGLKVEGELGRVGTNQHLMSPHVFQDAAFNEANDL